jgi:hypothetical protein
MRFWLDTLLIVMGGKIDSYILRYYFWMIYRFLYIFLALLRACRLYLSQHVYSTFISMTDHRLSSLFSLQQTNMFGTWNRNKSPYWITIHIEYCIARSLAIPSPNWRIGSVDTWLSLGKSVLFWSVIWLSCPGDSGHSWAGGNSDAPLSTLVAKATLRRKTGSSPNQWSVPTIDSL